jgi:hypothetical protein
LNFNRINCCCIDPGHKYHEKKETCVNKRENEAWICSKNNYFCGVPKNVLWTITIEDLYLTYSPEMNHISPGSKTTGGI